MIIVKINGGLGNQMFQYALYRSLKQINNDIVKLDLNEVRNYNLHNGYELEKVFNNLKIEEATDKEIIKLIGNKGLISKIVRKFKKSYFYSEDLNFNPDVLKFKKKYIWGYWQCEAYFQCITEILKNEFKFKQFDDKLNIQLEDICKKENCVSVHIRRGDYLSEENKHIYGGICEEEYYKKAIDFIREKVQNPKFIVFSNDISWCKKTFGNDNFIYVDWNTGENSYKDMQLMSYCKHNIIANSSFSWWGAWLNSNKNKIVISPKKWINIESANTDDIIPKEWIKI
jgi:hypothetical protein